ncbi:MAG: transcription elongation factor GreA [Planctomycetes bacterium]|nr:transcription elongation factor GreA [Planctomycetota bacterium]
MDRIPMTPRGYEQAKEKLDRMRNVELPRLQKSLGDAIELGDISENSEVETARHEIGIIEQLIAELTDKLARAEVIVPKASDAVGLGALVRVVDLDTRRDDEFLIVGEGETRPDVDTVSISSPLGTALLGKRVGEDAEVDAPRGRLRYRVTSLNYPA